MNILILFIKKTECQNSIQEFSVRNVGVINLDTTGNKYNYRDKRIINSLNYIGLDISQNVMLTH